MFKKLVIMTAIILLENCSRATVKGNNEPAGGDIAPTPNFTTCTNNSNAIIDKNGICLGSKYTGTDIKATKGLLLISPSGYLYHIVNTDGMISFGTSYIRNNNQQYEPDAIFGDKNKIFINSLSGSTHVISEAFYFGAEDKDKKRVIPESIYCHSEVDAFNPSADSKYTTWVPISGYIFVASEDTHPSRPILEVKTCTLDKLGLYDTNTAKLAGLKDISEIKLEL